jgi:hypothetical protein
MARGVDQVELLDLAIPGEVIHPYRVGLDRYSPFTFQIHGVQNLSLHLARRDRTGELEQTIGERGLAMIDVRYDREITNVFAIHAEMPVGGVRRRHISRCF